MGLHDALCTWLSGKADAHPSQSERDSRALQKNWQPAPRRRAGSKQIQHPCKLISIIHASISKQKTNRAVSPEMLMFHLQVSRRALQYEEF